MPQPPDLLTALLSSLSSQSLPLPSTSWLTTLLSSLTRTTTNNNNQAPPLNSLLATARARLLASDLTTPSLLDASYASTHCLPGDIARPEVKSTSLPCDIVLQVLDIETLSRSRWSQVEELEALARGEGTKGREIVRLPAGGGGEGQEEHQGERGMTQAPTQTQTQPHGRPAARANAASQAVSGAGDTHKLILQDCRGVKVSALELRKVEKIAIGKLNIGEKILVRKGAAVSRGVIMLEPATCLVLGGKIEAWHKAWVDGRLARLKEAATASGQPQGQGQGRTQTR